MSEKKPHASVPASPAKIDRNWDERFFRGETFSVPVTHFSGSRLHDESLDKFTVARLSSGFVSHLSEKTRSRIAAAVSEHFGTTSVADLVAHKVPFDIAEVLQKKGVHDASSYEAVRGENRIFSDLTEMDLLSSESMSTDEIRKIVSSLLVSSKGSPLSEKDAVETVNRTYGLALEFLDMLGITPNDTQRSRKFRSVESFVDHIDSLKPGSRRNGYGMVIECAIIRAMDDVHDVLSNDRYKRLDEEARLVLSKIRSFPGITLKEAGEGKFLISYVPPGAKGRAEFFQGILNMREKNFFKILLKMAFNRKYTSVESFDDLLGLRFETENPDQEHLANAVEFFAKHVFEDPEYDQKGNLIDLELLRERGIPLSKKLEPKDSDEPGPKDRPKEKSSTDEDIENGDITGHVSLRGGRGGGSKRTGRIEMQFQTVGGMDGGFRTSAYYDFKKLLTASARKMKGFDIKNLKFFIRLFLVPATGMSEKAILTRLCFPPKGAEPARSGEFVDAHWGQTHGFLLPLATGNGGVRFTTLDAFTPEYYAIYGRHYPTPARLSFDYLLRMYDRADVDSKVKEYRHKDWSI